MANPIDFPESNRNWKKPSSMTDEECGPLPAFVDDTHSVSCWQLSQMELEEVQRTGVVWLGVCGSQPPVWVTGERPFLKETIDV